MVLAGALTAVDLAVLETGALTGDATVSGFLRWGVLAALTGIGADVDFFTPLDRGLLVAWVLAWVPEDEEGTEAI